MLPITLLPENIARADGFGPAIDVSRETGKLLVLTLGITRILEQESLTISVWGSGDGTKWGSQPLATFPPKSYCGLYSILLNLSTHPEVRYVRVQWAMKRWSPPISEPLFAFFVEAEESGSRIQSAVA